MQESMVKIGDFCGDKYSRESIYTRIITMADPITPEMKAQQLQQLNAQKASLDNSIAATQSKLESVNTQLNTTNSEIDFYDRQIATAADPEAAQDAINAKYDLEQEKQTLLTQQSQAANALEDQTSALDDVNGEINTLENAPTTADDQQTPEDAELVPAKTQDGSAENPYELEEVVIEGTPDTSENLAGQTEQTLQQPTAQDLHNGVPKDWRVRLQLDPLGPQILYLDPNNTILSPLNATRGVVFPYTPSVNVNYNANYTPTSVPHSNYNIYNYVNSSVDGIQITCDFTAQDTYEANYLLAVIHFFKSVTKMFYGKDQYPKPGTPPPLCFLTGLGQFQFSEHPLAITNFNYSLPTDVDYVKSTRFVTFSGGSVAVGAENPQPPQNTNASPASSILARLGQGVVKGLGSVAGNFFEKHNLVPGGGLSSQGALGLGKGFQGAAFAQADGSTYVPTRMQIQISAVPIISRYDISNKFAFKWYGAGQLGGMW